MNRAQFLSLFAIPFLPKVDLSENDKCPFNVELIQKRIDFLKKYPLTENDAFPFKNYGIMIPQGEGKFKLLKEGGEVEMIEINWKGETKSEVVCRKL